MVRIVIVGNGFGGVYTLKNLRKIFKWDRNIRFSLVGEHNYFLFTPLLHEVATGGINPSNILEPIRRVLGSCLDQFHLGKMELINLKEKKIKVGDEIIPYDYLVLAPGSETNFYNIPGAEKYSLPLKSINDAIRIKNHCIRQMERASHLPSGPDRKKMLKFVVVGGGSTGVELVAELEELVKETFAHYYPKNVIADVSIVLIQRANELVPTFNPQIRQKSLAVLRRKGVEVILGKAVKEVGPKEVWIEDKQKIDTETVIWTAGIKPASLKFDQKVKQIPDGRFLVNEYLQLEGHQEIFIIGDAAAFPDKNDFIFALAQVAQKESAIVAKNIKLSIEGKELKKFVYHNSGILMSIGQWMGIGEIFNFTFSGRLIWLLWRTVHLFKLISWRKKFRVAVNWTMNLFGPRDISQL